MYYHLKASSGKKDENVILSGTIYDSGKNIVDRIFNSGKSIQEMYGKEKYTIVVNKKESSLGNWTDVVFNYVTNAGSILIVSDAARILFDQAGVNNLEYFDLTITTKKEKITNYQIVNVVGKIDCVDTKKSNIVLRRNGNIKDVKKLVFDHKKVPADLKIFLLAKYKAAKVFVTKPLKETIETSLKGFACTPVEKCIGEF